MARNLAALFLNHLMDLSNYIVCGINAYDVFKPWMKTANQRFIYHRIVLYKQFIKFIDENCYTMDSWCAEMFTRWVENMKKSDKKSSVMVKASYIRQILLAAQEDGVIPNCIFYERRGRKPTNPITSLCVVPKEKKSPTCTSRRSIYNKSSNRAILYELLGLNEDFSQDELKKAFKRVSMRFHPDKNTSKAAIDQFIACKQIYDFLADEDNKSLYRKFVNQKRGRPNPQINGFVSGISRIFAEA